jgi:hypothetical protein
MKAHRADHPPTFGGVEEPGSLVFRGPEHAPLMVGPIVKPHPFNINLVAEAEDGLTLVLRVSKTDFHDPAP